MKRLISICLAGAMIIMGLSVLPSAVTAKADSLNDDLVIANYNYSSVPKWYDDGFLDHLSIDSTHANSGSALKYDVPVAPGRYPHVGFSGNEWSYYGWDKYNALKFWVHADKADCESASDTIRFGFAVQDYTDYQNERAIIGATYYKNGVADQLATEAASTGTGGIVLPDGFEGWVTIPFSSIAMDSVKGVNRIAIWTNTAFGGWDLYFDDITLTNIDDTTVFDDFSTYAPGDTVPAASAQGTTNLGFTADAGEDGSTAVSFTVANDGASISFGQNGQDRLEYWPSQWAASGNAFRFWLRNGSASALPLKVTLTDKSGNTASLAPDCWYLTGSTLYRTNANGAASIPASYAGPVTLPFDSFAVGIDLTNIVAIQLSFGSEAAGAAITLDTLGIARIAKYYYPGDKPVVDNGYPAIVPDSQTMIQDFDSLTPDTLSSAVSVYNNSIKAALTTRTFDGTQGQALELSVISGSYGTITVKNQQDLSGHNMLRFYIRYDLLNERYQPYVMLENITLRTSSGSWVLDTAAPAYCIYAADGMEDYSPEKQQGTHALSIGADFEGYYEIPFTSFRCVETDMLADEVTNPIDLASLGEISFSINGGYFTEATLFLDSISAATGDFYTQPSRLLLLDPDNTGFLFRAEETALPYDTVMKVEKMNPESSIAVNLKELLEEGGYQGEVAFFSLKTTRMQYPSLSTHAESGKIAYISFPAPEGYEHPQIVRLTSGDVVPLETTLSNGRITAAVDALGTETLAIIDGEIIEGPDPTEPTTPTDPSTPTDPTAPTQPAPTTPSDEGNGGNGNGNGNSNGEDGQNSPDTGIPAPLMLVPVIAASAVALLLLRRKKA